MIRQPAASERGLVNATRRRLDICCELSISYVEMPLPQPMLKRSEGPASFGLAIFLDGSGCFSIEGDHPVDFSPGCAVLFFNEAWTRGQNEFFAGRPLRVVDIRFDREKIGDLAGSLLDPGDPGSLIARRRRDGAPLMLVFPASADLIEVAQDIADCRYAAPAVREIFLRGLAFKGLAIALDTLETPDAAILPLDSAEIGKIRLGRELIDTRFFEPWTIPLLARRIALSERKLKVGFREVVGVSIRTYLRRVRVHAACRLIQSGSSITDAALESGFGNLSHFSKTFRGIVGVGPREFAKRKTVRASR